MAIIPLLFRGWAGPPRVLVPYNSNGLVQRFSFMLTCPIMAIIPLLFFRGWAGPIMVLWLPYPYYSKGPLQFYGNVTYRIYLLCPTIPIHFRQALELSALRPSRFYTSHGCALQLHQQGEAPTILCPLRATTY